MILMSRRGLLNAGHPNVQPEILTNVFGTFTNDHPVLNKLDKTGTDKNYNKCKSANTWLATVGHLEFFL